MAKKYGDIQGTDQKTPKSKDRKDLILSKEKLKWAVFAFFSPSRDDDD